MNRGTLVGVSLSLLGLAGYVAGVVVDYPGRAFSLTAIMIGLVLVATTHQSGAEAGP